MARVIPFSRVFPKGHPKEGQPTYFVEKFQDAICQLGNIEITDEQLKIGVAFTKDLVWPKWHTIRAGHRWKVGDKFSPRVWSGKAYQSKQIIIAPDIEIKKIWSVEIDLVDQYEGIAIIDESGGEIAVDTKKISLNDGLSEDDFYDWFAIHPKARKEVFKGQIICWNEQINY